MNLGQNAILWLKLSRQCFFHLINTLDFWYSFQAFKNSLGDRHLDIYNETLRQRANRQTKSFEAPDCNEEPLKAKGSEEEVLTIDVENTKHTAKDQMKLVHPPSKRR